jgi:glucokinase
MSSPDVSAGNYIGVEVSGTTLRVALVSPEGAVIERRELALEREGVRDQIARAASELRDAAGGANVAGLGVGLPGLVNPASGHVVFSTDFPTLARGDLDADLQRSTGLSVLVENDANAAAYGEFLAGAGRGSRHMFYITIGVGIGGSFIFDGKIWRGASGFAGEFGHITIDPEGIECACGNTGCLETVASAPNIVRRTHERLFRDGTSSLSRLAMNREFTASDIAHEATTATTSRAS